MVSHEQKRHRDFVKGLREMADWYEQHPETPIPAAPSFMIMVNDGVSFRKAVQAARSGKKTEFGNYIGFSKMFGGVGWTIAISRSVICERIQVGEREVPAEPAKPARTEPIYEWKCPESLLSPESAKTAR